MSSGQLRIEVELVDREPFIVTTTLLDHNTWDLTRARHKWPTAQDAALTWLGFLAWSASRRTGAIETGMGWEQFLGECLSVRQPDEDVDEAVADPILAGPGPA